MLRLVLPLLVFVMIGLTLWRGLSLKPHEAQSPLINKPVPSFSVPSLTTPTKKLNQKIFVGHVSLLNVFSSWCIYCLAEHSIIMNGARLSKLSVYGLNYKDRRAAALKWLAKNGNPYAEILFDPKATFAMRLGVYGVPETFIIDTKAVIRYRRVGPISPELWRDELKPKILQLLAEARHVT